MKRRKALVGILLSMLVLSACSFSNLKEENVVPENINTEETDSAVSYDTALIEDVFEPHMPAHQGIWQVSDYGNISYYYEFGAEDSGRRVRANEGNIEEFTYEVTDEENLVFHYDNRDEYAHFSFGDDGKHLVLTYKDYQQSLLWVSHGTLEDMGGLGLSFTAEDVTPFGCTLKYTQNGGYVTGEITEDKSFSIILHDEGDNEWGFTDYFGDEEQTFTIEKDSSGSLTLDWSSKIGILKPGEYVLAFNIKDVRNVGGDWDSFDYRVWFTVPDIDAEELIEKAVTTSGADRNDVRNYAAYDYDGDGYLEAFVFIGSETDEMWSTCSGTVWFVDDDNCESVQENESFFVYGNKVIDMVNVDGHIFAHTRVAYATSTVSYLYYVKDGNCRESEISGLGSFFKSDYTDGYSVSVSAYDYCLDYDEGKESEGLYTGHTWKHYYFYYDEETEDFKEYVGTPITESELASECGFDLVGDIRKEGYQIDDIFKRDNGVINVNYSKTSKGGGTVSVEYHNATYNVNTQRFADAWDSNANTWENSDFGGIYLSAITE